jgi:hypothetical protein
MEAHLRAGLAIYNGGRHHAAHDAWEERWLALEDGPDERFLHGLIQVTDAVHHAREGNWAGATGLAGSARGYLDGLGDTHRGVALAPVRGYLTTLERDPEVVERRPPVALVHDGERVRPADLDFDATAVAAGVLAAADGFDTGTVERAAEYGRGDLDDGRTASPFVTLLFDFVREPDRRGIVFQRLSEHVRRRRSREEDVAGLFE